jgi:hypothetical protein
MWVSCLWEKVNAKDGNAEYGSMADKAGGYVRPVEIKVGEYVGLQLENIGWRAGQDIQGIICQKGSRLIVCTRMWIIN